VGEGARGRLALLIFIFICGVVPPIIPSRRWGMMAHRRYMCITLELFHSGWSRTLTIKLPMGIAMIILSGSLAPILNNAHLVAIFACALCKKSWAKCTLLPRPSLHGNLPLIRLLMFWSSQRNHVEGLRGERGVIYGISGRHNPPTGTLDFVRALQTVTSTTKCLFGAAKSNHTTSQGRYRDALDRIRRTSKRKSFPLSLCQFALYYKLTVHTNLFLLAIATTGVSVDGERNWKDVRLLVSYNKM
jgi:hypothetical protein